MKVIKNKNVKSFLHMLAGYKKKHIIALIFSIANSALIIFQPIVLMHIIDDGIMQKNLRNILVYISIYLGVVILQNIVNIIATYSYSSIGKSFIYDLRIKLLKHVQSQSGYVQTNFETGELFTIFEKGVVLLSACFSICHKMRSCLICIFTNSLHYFVATQEVPGLQIHYIKSSHR